MCVNHPDREGKKKSHRRWGSWVTASQEHHSLPCVLPIWSLRPSLFLLVPQTLFYYLQGQETQYLHAVQSAFQYSWWLQRASFACIPVWLYNFAYGFNAILWGHAMEVYYPFHTRGLHMIIICLESSLL